MTDHDHRLDDAAKLLREPVPLDPELHDRIMAAVRATPAPRRWVRPLWTASTWLGRPRTIRVRPLTGLAAAAALAFLWIARGPTGMDDPPAGLEATAVASAGSVVQFVVVAPSAEVVALVGDFNDWRFDATPMTRSEGNGVWSVTIPLDPGRYRYAFVVDNDVWMRDPSAPPAPDDEFERPGSVVTVGES